MDPRLHRADRRIGHGGDLTVVHAVHVAQHHRDALVLRKHPERLLEEPVQLALLRLLERVDGADVRQFGLAPLRLRQRGGWAPPRSAQDVVRGIGGNAHQPRSEYPAAIAAERVVGVDEGILRGVRGLVRIAE